MEATVSRSHCAKCGQHRHTCKGRRFYNIAGTRYCRACYNKMVVRAMKEALESGPDLPPFPLPMPPKEKPAPVVFVGFDAAREDSSLAILRRELLSDTIIDPGFIDGSYVKGTDDLIDCLRYGMMIHERQTRETRLQRAWAWITRILQG